ncbi:MAG: HAD family phosphatase [Candidatus Bathyarchaeia archaeon]
MFEAVIFDWDGTLADTKSFVVYSFKKVLREIGCNVNDEFIERRMGIGPRNTFKEALKFANIPFDEELIDKLEEKKVNIQLKRSKDVNLFEGASELLNLLYMNKKIALATMSNQKVIDKILNEKGIRKYFDALVTFDEVLSPKPDPEVFIKCAAKLGCQPEKCVVIEDSIFGVKAAKKARMKCIAVPSGAYSAEELKIENPDLIVNSLKEKEKILSFIFDK